MNASQPSPPLSQKRSDLKKMVVDLTRYYRQTQEIVAKWKEGYCFPSGYININDPVIVQNWSKLRRACDCMADREDEERFKSWVEVVRPYTMVSYDPLFSLVQQVRYCEENGIPGAYVEAGCCRGGAAALMGKACLHYGSSPRPIHVFDSFEGLPQPDAAKDTDDWIAKTWGIPLDQHLGKMVGTGALIAHEAYVQHVFGLIGYPPSHLYIYKGWFCDTMPEVASEIGPIAILRLDGDLYSSTWDTLINLYAQVVEGGIVIIDDYGITGARQATLDFLKTLPRRPYISQIDSVTSYFIKQK